MITDETTKLNVSDTRVNNKYSTSFTIENLISRQSPPAGVNNQIEQPLINLSQNLPASTAIYKNPWIRSYFAHQQSPVNKYIGPLEILPAGSAEQRIKEFLVDPRVVISANESRFLAQSLKDNEHNRMFSDLLVLNGEYYASGTNWAAYTQSTSNLVHSNTSGDSIGYGMKADEDVDDNILTAQNNLDGSNADDDENDSDSDCSDISMSPDVLLNGNMEFNDTKIVYSRIF